MGTTVTFNNTSYIVPALGDSNWGDNVSNYLIAIASGSLQKSGGNFTLTADIDFGATYGLKAAYFISKATNPSGTGVLRLGNTQSVGWRNAANSADLNLSVSALDVLEFGGTKLLLSGQIVNADIATLAAIALTKLAALPTTERVLVSNATGVITESAVTSTTLGYLDATSSIQTQLNGKEPSITTLGISKGGTNSSTALTNDKVIISNAGAIVESAVTTTTLGYLDATSSIQTQLNGKEPTITTLSVAKGGTNSGTALNNNRVIKSSSGAIVEAAAITANRALISDADGIPTHSSVTETELGYVSGVTSAIQTQLGNKAPLVSPSFTTPDIGAATGTSLVVGTTPSLDASAALEVDSTTKGFLPPRMTQAQRDAIGSPATGLQVYNTTTSKVNVYDGATWVEVGSGQGGINYIADYDGSTLGAWATYADAASAQPTDGTGGSPTVTFVSSSSSAMRGTTNFLFTHDASNQQGQGFSYLCNIDPSDRGSVIRFGFEYLVASGTYASGDLTVWFYDVTNAQIIQGAPTSILNSGIIETFQSEVQVPISCAQMRVIVHVSTNTATAYTMRFDNFAFGPQEKSYGSLITDYISWTPTGTWTTATTYTGKWKRVGDSMEVAVGVTLGGAPNTAVMRVDLPSGYAIDTAKLSLNKSQFLWVGEGAVEDASLSTAHKIYVAYLNSTQVELRFQSAASSTSSATSQVTQANPITFAISDSINFKYSVPILGWSSSSQVVSSEDDGRVVAMTAAKSTSQNIATGGASPTTITGFDTAEIDTHGKFNATTGVYTVAVPGRYSVTGSVGFASSAAGVRVTSLRKNGTDVAISSTAAVSGSAISSTAAKIINLVAGDTISLAGFQNSGGTVGTTTDPKYTYLNIQLLQGPSQIMAGESVNCRYTSNSGQLIEAAGTGEIINFNLKDYDSHGMVITGATWKMTAPVPGVYAYSVCLVYQDYSWAVGNSSEVVIRKNGTTIKGDFIEIEATNTLIVTHKLDGEIYLNAGDYLDVVLDHNRTGGDANLTTTARAVQFTAHRVGL